VGYETEVDIVEGKQVSFTRTMGTGMEQETAQTGMTGAGMTCSQHWLFIRASRG
jgi:hypothetical protein